MGLPQPDEPELPVTCSGGTSIRQTTLQILQDHEDQVWDGGENPKIIFLTDGYATDLSSGFLFFGNHMHAFRSALQRYNRLGISISTVGLGSSLDENLMEEMAQKTGGVFIHVADAANLTEAMKTAAVSYSERDLLSARYMPTLSALFGILRVLFLSLIGTLIGGLLAFAYMDDNSVPLIFAASAADSVLGSLMLELGVQSGSSQQLFRLILWILFAMTIGYAYPRGSSPFRTQNARTRRRSRWETGCQTGGRNIRL